MLQRSDFLALALTSIEAYYQGFGLIKLGRAFGPRSSQLKMNYNQDDYLGSSMSNEGISLPEGSKFDHNSIAEVHMDSPLNRLVGVRQTSSQLYSTLGQSSTCFSHPLGDYYQPVHQFEESSQWSYSNDVCSQQADRFLYPEQTCNLFSSQQKEMYLDTNMPQRRFQYVKNPNPPPQQINYFSYPALSQESNFFTPKRHNESHPLQLSEVTTPPCYNFQPLSSVEESLPHALPVPYRRYELFPEKESIFHVVWKSATSAVDQSSNCRKNSRFINFTNQTWNDSAMFSRSGSMHLTNSNVNQAKNIPQLFDSTSRNTHSSLFIRNNDYYNNQAGKNFLESESFFESASSTDQSSNGRQRLPCFINITNQAQIDSPMFSPDGSPEYTDENILRKSIDKLVEHVIMVTQTDIPVINPNANNLQSEQLFGPPLMTYQTCSPEYLRDRNVNRVRNSSRRNARNARNAAFYKTVLCMHFDEGYCSRGSYCKFAHGSEELRPQIRHPKYKTRLCQELLRTGKCSYGDRCIFRHPRAPFLPPRNLDSDGETAPESEG